MIYDKNILDKCEERERLLNERQALRLQFEINDDKLGKINDELEELCGNLFMFYDADRKRIVLPERKKREAKVVFMDKPVIQKPYEFTHYPDIMEEKAYKKQVK